MTHGELPDAPSPSAARPPEPSPSAPAPSRRTVLTGVAGIALGLGAGVTGRGLLTSADRTGPSASPSLPSTTTTPAIAPPTSAPSPVVATGTAQAGITRPTTPQPHGLLTVLDLDDVRALRGAHGTEWLAALGHRILTLTTDPAPALLPDGAHDLTVTVGLGPNAVRAIDPALPGATDLDTFASDGAIPATHRGGDVLITVHASDAGVVAPVGAHLATMVPGEVRWTQRVFRGPGEGTVVRNPLGFHDGVTVPRTDDELARDVWLDADSGPPGTDLTGASICVLRRLRLDVEAFTALTVPDREAVIGRHLADGSPLSGGTLLDDVDLHAKHADGTYLIPSRAHVRAAHPSFTGAELMLRRGYAFDDGGTDHGLMFICFQRSLRTFEATQHRLDEVDDLGRFSTPTASATFLVLPGFSADRPLGSTLG